MTMAVERPAPGTRDATATRPQPYLPLYAADFLAQTVMWTGPECGLLVVLWVLEWVSGPLPLELDRIAKAARYPPRVFRQLWQRVSTAFVETPEGWVCRRIEELLEHALALSRKRAEAGSRGGAKPKQPESKREAIASDLLKQSGQERSGQVEGTPSVPPLSDPQTSVQSLAPTPATAAKNLAGERPFPTEMTPDIEELISSARPECFPATVFQKWREHNLAKPPADWRGSLRRFAQMEKFDERQWEQRKAATTTQRRGEGGLKRILARGRE